MTADIALAVLAAVDAQQLNVSLRGIEVTRRRGWACRSCGRAAAPRPALRVPLTRLLPQMGDSWISGQADVDSWGPFLYGASEINDVGAASIKTGSDACDAAIAAGDWAGATNAWGNTENLVLDAANGEWSPEGVGAALNRLLTRALTPPSPPPALLTHRARGRLL